MIPQPARFDGPSPRCENAARVLGSMKGMKAFGRYGSLGFELLASIAVGYYGGRFLDRKLDTHWIAFVGFLLGCYAGFRALFKAASRMQRDIENDEALERGEDPWDKEKVAQLKKEKEDERNGDA